jgi:hypothetical protein
MSNPAESEGEFERSPLWYDRLSYHLALGKWLGRVLFGACAFAVVELLVYGVGTVSRNPVYLAGGITLPGAAFVDFLIFIGDWIILITYAEFAAGIIWKNTVWLCQLAESMGSGTAFLRVKSMVRKGYFGGKIVLVLVAMIALGTYLQIFSTGSQYLNPASAMAQIPHIFGVTFISLFAAMATMNLFSTLTTLKSTLRLRPFSEDLSLGLKPFVMSGIYNSIMIEFSILLVVALPPFELPNLPVALFLIVVFSLYFTPPILLAHSKIGPVKKERVDWIGKWYTSVMDRLHGGTALDPQLGDELFAIDKIQRDITKIHVWGVDAGILWPIVSAIVGGIGLRLVLTLLGGQ